MIIHHRGTSRRAASYEQIEPLVDLCKAGKLFEVQEWIREEKPVNVPSGYLSTRYRKKTPLEVAMHLGFHSLIKVLLEAGTILEPVGVYSPMNRALEMKHLDIIKLFVDCGGYDPKMVDMADVFETWDREIMEYFISNGAEVEKGNPLAYALSQRIRTTLGIFKQYQDKFPSFKEQANIALRHHAAEGNLKWVSLMLWAGADPYAIGTRYYNEAELDDEGHSALGYAALYGNLEVFKLKAIRLDPKHPVMSEVMRFVSQDENGDLLRRLIEMGVELNTQDNGGSESLNHILTSMGRGFFDPSTFEIQRRNIDSSESRKKLKSIHLLTKHGARWVPEDRYEIAQARKALLSLKPDYTVEFVWIMSKYSSCTVESIQQLIKTPAIRTHIRDHNARVDELISC